MVVAVDLLLFSMNGTSSHVPATQPHSIPTLREMKLHNRVIHVYKQFDSLMTSQLVSNRSHVIPLASTVVMK